MPESAETADLIEEIGDEIAVLAAHVYAATHRMLVLVAKFDQLRGWDRAGFKSCAHWLAYRTGFDLGACREKVRVARALEELPETSAVMAQGQLSFAQARALTRVATTENEQMLLDVARSGTAAQLERVVRAWKRFGRLDEIEHEQRRHAARCLSIFPDEDGTYVVRGRLAPETAALLMRAIEAASDALYRGAKSEVTPERRQADALGLLAERAMAAGFEDGPVSGTRAERYQVVLHVEPSTLRSDAEPSTLRSDAEPGRAELEDGTRVSAETCRRLTCDASVVTVTQAADASVLDVGRRMRTTPPPIRRALEVRDRGCRFPGCGVRFADAHHIEHWADGGETSLENLILLCPHHHRLLHEGGFRMELNAWPGGRPTFYTPRGLPVPEAPAAMALDDLTIEELTRTNPDYRTCTATHRSELDVPAETLDRLAEAILPPAARREPATAA
jgi:hypothetical protein